MAVLLSASPAWAQQDHQHTASPQAWQWHMDANVFAGYNYQRREFTDFDEFESQNWLMTMLTKTFSTGSTIQAIGMFSLEPFTLRKIGSPQVFQTGETFNGAPLIDYQHPHDLLMNLGAEYTHLAGSTTITLTAHAVGPAPIGPRVFMHRPSAASNPQSPLSHHHLDATHVTPGVVSIGVARSGFSVEAGAFRGREPDEDRLDLDTAALDSYSARLSWAGGPWRLQVSGADLKTPERKSPYDASRITASAEYINGHGLAWMAAFGQNREVFGNLEAYLIEAAKRSGRHEFYTRAELVQKDILDAGFHPIGVAHVHRPSRVGAMTVGYVRDLSARRWGSFAVGGDVTGYRVPSNLAESYGSPVSLHLFVRYRGGS